MLQISLHKPYKLMYYQIQIQILKKKKLISYIYLLCGWNNTNHINIGTESFNIKLMLI